MPRKHQSREPHLSPRRLEAVKKAQQPWNLEWRGAAKLKVERLNI